MYSIGSCTYIPHPECLSGMLFNSSVVGQEELDARSVNVRNRDDVGTKARSETIPLDEIVQKLVALKDRQNLQNKLV